MKEKLKALWLRMTGKEASDEDITALEGVIKPVEAPKPEEKKTPVISEPEEKKDPIIPKSDDSDKEFLKTLAENIEKINAKMLEQEKAAAESQKTELERKIETALQAAKGKKYATTDTAAEESWRNVLKANYEAGVKALGVVPEIGAIRQTSGANQPGTTPVTAQDYNAVKAQAAAVFNRNSETQNLNKV